MRRFALPLLVLAAPMVSFAAPRTFQELASYIVFLMNNAVAVLVVLGLVIYFWGVTANLKKASEGDAQARKNIIFWGVVALFVMVSVWGILRLLQNTLFSGAGAAGLGSGGSVPAYCDSFGNCGE
jgi:hypothetical protein